MIPSVDDLRDFLEKNQSANFSQIARKFGISIITVSELIKPLLRKKRILIRQIGPNKFVEVIKEE